MLAAWTLKFDIHSENNPFFKPIEAQRRHNVKVRHELILRLIELLFWDASLQDRVFLFGNVLGKWLYSNYINP